MTRVPVPDDYERRDVPLPESMDYDDLRSVVGDPGRVAQVREDEDGRYVGVPEQYVEDVAEHLGVGVSEADENESDEDGNELVGSFDPNEHTVSEVREHVEDIDGDNLAAELDAIRDAEADGKERTTALEAIDDCRDELEE